MKHQLARTFVCLAIPLGLSGCGVTGRFVNQPPLSLSDATVGKQQAVTQLFDDAQPYKIKFCAADQASKNCKSDSGLSAFGLGGPALPLSMNVDDLAIKSIKPAADGFAFSSQVDATVDAIPDSHQWNQRHRFGPAQQLLLQLGRDRKRPGQHETLDRPHRPCRPDIHRILPDHVLRHWQCFRIGLFQGNNRQARYLALFH